MISSQDATAALETAAVLACSGVPASTLNYWVSKGLCEPSVMPGRGQRSPRYWSARDLVTVRAIKALREAGCPLQIVSRVKALLLTEWDTEIASSVLFYDGNDVVLIDFDRQAVLSVVRETGQGIFVEAMQMMTFPIRRWLDEADALLKPIDLDDVRSRERASRGRTATRSLVPARRTTRTA
ncbi:MerR family transcriptional regulator [Herbiconiux ginsengi]|uniref:MerR HTH family regulatory protein n=1 Tax=Herbiconiux ginsengi TaxID=381665 RepID=A0A1H3M5S7_9MICO|nr:MerR family transcriptional regulator [Herbiconiux ginsengi]SDY71355.1 MerR HTH family regulatory protein [Herbiconiux ginsengi]